MAITALAALLALPAAGYLGANLIEWAANAEGTSGVFGSAFEGWSSITLTLIVVGGPLLSLVLIALSSVRLRQVARESGTVRASVDFRMPTTRAGVAVTTALLLAGTVAYWFAQSWPCVHGGQWLC